MGCGADGVHQKNCSGAGPVITTHLAFHHIDGTLARRILKNTLEPGDGFAIFELQGCSIASVIGVPALGIGIILLALVYAVCLDAPDALFFYWALVLVFDGLMPPLRR